MYFSCIRKICKFRFCYLIQAATDIFFFNFRIDSIDETIDFPNVIPFIVSWNSRLATWIQHNSLAFIYCLQ